MYLFDLTECVQPEYGDTIQSKYVLNKYRAWLMSRNTIIVLEYISHRFIDLVQALNRSTLITSLITY
jgi:hypothetical protein